MARPAPVKIYANRRSDDGAGIVRDVEIEDDLADAGC
jgi:hypothetical protein